MIRIELVEDGLPTAVLYDYVDAIDFLSMDMTAPPGRSYRYYSGEPLWPFGFGLSYTTFELAWSPRPPGRATLRTDDATAAPPPPP